MGEFSSAFYILYFPCNPLLCAINVQLFGKSFRLEWFRYYFVYGINWLNHHIWPRLYAIEFFLTLVCFCMITFYIKIWFYWAKKVSVLHSVSAVIFGGMCWSAEAWFQSSVHWYSFCNGKCFISYVFLK